MYRFSLVLRGLWWRRGLTFAVLIVAAVTTGAAALGPLYARAASESTLADQLSAAPSSSSGLHYSSDIDITAPGALSTAVSLAPHPGVIAGYPRHILGLYAGTNVDGPTVPVISGVLARDGACGHVVIVHGRCPTKRREVLASQRTIDSGYGWHVGTSLGLDGLHVSRDNGSGDPVYAPARVTVVGTYRPRNTNDPFWFGKPYFSPHPGDIGKPDTVDTLIASRSIFLNSAPPQIAELDVDLPLQPSAVHLADIAQLQKQVHALQNKVHIQVANGANGLGVVHPLGTKIFAVVRAASHQQSLVRVGTTLVSLQLGLLAWLVLFQVMSDAAEARGNEIALAKVRGRRAMSTLAFGLSEPLLLLLIAIPLGLLVAVIAAHVFAASVLRAGTPVVLPFGAVVAALVAFAGGVVAAAVTGQRTLTRSVLDQWGRSRRSTRPGRIGVVIDLVVAAAAIATLVVLRVNGNTDGGSLALLGPGLLVAAVALVGTRLLPLFCRALYRPTRSSRRLGLFLAVRQVGRRSAGLRLASLLGIALGLATFAVAGEAVAHDNRQARASAEVGAPKVVSVQYTPAVDPLAAVARADPHGRWAMAAATYLPFGGDSVSGPVLAVDSRRLAQVASPVSGGPALSQIAKLAGAQQVPDVAVHATRLRVHLTATFRTPGPQPFLVVRLRSQRKPSLPVAGPTLRSGSHDYVVDVPCAATGCTLAGFYWERPVDADGEQRGTVVLSGVDSAGGRSGDTVWKALPLHVTEHGGWRATSALGQASDHVTASTAGARDDYRSTGGGYGGIDYAFPPSPIPALATRSALTTGTAVPKPRLLADGLNNSTPFVVRRIAKVLPVVLGNGVLVDVRYVTEQLPAFADEADWQVWLGSHAPRDALARLRAAGLTVQDERTVAQRTTVLARQGPALALVLLLGCALAGAVLAVGATAISVSASSRRRSYELAAMRAVDVPRGALTRAGVLEQLLLLGGAVVLGVPAGLLAARLALPTIPEFADRTAVTLRYGPPALPITLFVAGFVVLLLLTAVSATVNLVRVAVPSRLREGVG